MVTLSKIYTRGGDKGKTSLGGGKRVAKHSLRVAAYGTSDEANAVIGVTRLHTEGEADAMLSRIQNDLFDVGADLCTPPDAARKDGALRVTMAQVERLSGCHPRRHLPRSWRDQVLRRLKTKLPSSSTPSRRLTGRFRQHKQTST